MAKYNVSFYVPVFRESFTYPMEFTEEEYSKFKKLCVAYAKEERLGSIDLAGFVDWCYEEQNDSWIPSIYDGLVSEIYQFLVNYTLNGGFGKPDAVILSVYDDFCDENPDFYDEFGNLEYTDSAIYEFFSQLEYDYEPLYELEIDSL